MGLVVDEFDVVGDYVVDVCFLDLFFVFFDEFGVVGN